MSTRWCFSSALKTESNLKSVGCGLISREVRAAYQLDSQRINGSANWLRVRNTGIALVRLTPHQNATVVGAFTIRDDSRHIDEGYDLGRGQCAEVCGVPVHHRRLCGGVESVEGAAELSVDVVGLRDAMGALPRCERGRRLEAAGGPPLRKLPHQRPLAAVARWLRGLGAAGKNYLIRSPSAPPPQSAGSV